MGMPRCVSYSTFSGYASCWSSFHRSRSTHCSGGFIQPRFSGTRQRYVRIPERVDLCYDGRESEWDTKWRPTLECWWWVEERILRLCNLEIEWRWVPMLHL